MGIRLVSLAMLAAALTGCAQAAPQQSAQPARPGAPSAAGVAWTNRLCDLVGGFVTSQQHAPPVDKSSAQALKASSVAQISASEQAAGNTVNGLRTMGPSPIPGADPIPGTLANGFGQVHDVMDAARTKAEQVDVTNNQTFAAGMAGVQQELQRGQSINLGAGLSEFDKNPQLTAAAAQAPSCKILMHQQQPPQSQQSPPPSR